MPAAYDPTKVIDLLIKYKNQVTALICIIIACACFMFGRMSVHIPPKKIVCEKEIQTADKLNAQLTKLRVDHIQEIRETTDTAEKECQQRIIKEVDDFKAKSPTLDCRIAKSIYPQCKKKGLWK
jgi:hypothetical protein